jgi:hypothetical protein
VLNHERLGGTAFAGQVAIEHTPPARRFLLVQEMVGERKDLLGITAGGGRECDPSPAR